MVEDPSTPPGEFPAWLSIGDWTLDVEGDRLLRDDEVAKLEPRLTRLLLCLAREAPHVVPVTTLLEAVWADVVVTPESVYQAVAALRRAFGDDAHHPRHIVNVPRKGYRLVAEVRPAAPPSLARPSSGHATPAGTATPSAATGGIDDRPSLGIAPAPPAKARAAAQQTEARTTHVRLAAVLTALVAATVGARLWLNTAPNDAAESLEAAPGAAAVVGGPPASARPVFRKVLWVDDKPRNNERERDAMAAFGVDFVLARSTAEAVDLLASNRFDLVVSDLHRPDDPNAGITLLSHMRQRLGDRTPFVLYTRQCSSERAMEVRALGALACTEQISGLMHAALLALESRP